jgi:ribosomal protein S18 acetylase RimI-like enzyme
MLGRGIDQWRPGEIPLAWIERFAEQRSLFAMFGDGRLVASVILAWADPFVWGAQQEPAGYVHMLMVNRAYAGRGLGRVLLDWTESRIGESGRHRARLDCVRTNTSLRGYYENAGYQLVGFRCFDHEASEALDGLVPADSALYEKVLTPHDATGP